MSSLNELFLSSSFRDERIWTLEYFGRFSSKSQFHNLTQPRSQLRPFSFKKVWMSSMPLRVKAFSWTASLSCINTMDMLQRRRPFMMLSPNWCVVLCKDNEESTKHLFIHCLFSKAIWDHFIGSLNRSWVMPNEMLDLFSQWKLVFHF